MRRRIFVFGIFLIVAFGFQSTPALAKGDLTQLLATVKKIELKNAAGDWFILEQGSRVFNFTQNEPLLKITNDGKIPAGIYTNIRVTLGEKMQFSGSDGENKTKAGGEVVYAGSAAKYSDFPFEDLLDFKEVSPSWTKDAEGLSTITFDLDFRDRDDTMEVYGKRDFKKILEIKAKSSIRIALSVDTKDAVNFVWQASLTPQFPKAEAMYILPPHFVEASVNVDGTTALLQGDSLEIAF